MGGIVVSFEKNGWPTKAEKSGCAKRRTMKPTTSRREESGTVTVK